MPLTHRDTFSADTHSNQLTLQWRFFLILTLDSFFVLQDESPPFLPSRIEFPKYLRSSWYTHSSVDAVSHRMWVKPCANLYTRMSEHLGISPISKKFSLILMPLCTQLTLTTSKFFLPPLTHTS